MKKYLLLFFIIVCSFLSACEDADPQRDELTGSSWTFVYFLDKENDKRILYQGENKMGLSFGSHGDLSVNGYCNTGGGSYKIKRESLSISDLSMTTMGCIPENMNNIEDWYFSSLDQAESFERTPDSLKIFSAGSYDLTFYKEE